MCSFICDIVGVDVAMNISQNLHLFLIDKCYSVRDNYILYPDIYSLVFINVLQSLFIILI